MSDSSLPARIPEFAEALQTVLRHAAELGAGAAESVSLQASVGRVLAQEVRADRDQPPFNRATRDGFAVRAEEWTAGARLKAVGQVRAGEVWAGDELRAGCAIEIMTGAPLPPGADAVAMVEHVELADGEVWAAPGRSLRSGENVVARGSEARAGEPVLRSGTEIGAAEIALAAACGYAELLVYARPAVAIVATGDELVELGQTPLFHQIRNSNSYALAALVESAGGEARRLRIARDTRDDLRARLDEAAAADLIILSGGVSAGKYDLVEEVLAKVGAEFLFTGVKMQPGKPVVFGRIERRGGTANRPAHKSADKPRWTYFFGLPGNPVSTEVTFRCFVQPMLRALCGAATVGPRLVQATLTEEVRAKPGLTRLLPALLKPDLVRPEVRLVGWQGSGDLAANARANCYAVLQDGKDLRAGDGITVLLR